MYTWRSWFDNIVILVLNSGGVWFNNVFNHKKLINFGCWAFDIITLWSAQVKKMTLSLEIVCNKGSSTSCIHECVIEAFVGIFNLEACVMPFPGHRHRSEAKANSMVKRAYTMTNSDHQTFPSDWAA